ncbi:hypothetical protein [Lysobacter enzymogenes]|uniref:hypothetical protein n=1 Tax=Lysobacter enzymogenes TaxID=69 RepID=UPI0011169CC4|nr:hypothetical protein [Lysobacter enzymogenes]UZW58393.1 hypothetical protein BV903_013795 [Lysobacter enzymogenes]
MLERARHRPIPACVLGLALLYGMTAPASALASGAQDDAAPAAAVGASPGGPAPALTPTPAPTPAPKVSAVDGVLQLDDIAEVTVANLKEWAATHDPAKLVPFIDGRAIRGNYPEEVHPHEGRIYFHLKITPESKEHWTDLLGAPDSMRRPVRFSIGLEDHAPFETVHDKTNPLLMTVISPVFGATAALVASLTLILFIRLARSTSIIREPGAAPADGSPKAYNLGRTQMAFWFFLIYVSYLVIWLITDMLDTITPSLLGLMGISAGTALSEALIDSSKDSAHSERGWNLSAERRELEKTIADLKLERAGLDAGAAATPDEIAQREPLDGKIQAARARLAQAAHRFSSLDSKKSARASRGFLRDVMADRDGYSFHRFQIFAWTIVLGIMFVSSVYNSLAMPEFSATLLGLMGLSSGTYIGFKFPERQE